MRNTQIKIIIALSLIFCLIYIVTNRMPEQFTFGYELMEFGYAVAVSIIAAGIFYYFQIVEPAKQTIKRFQNNAQRYKKNILSIILEVSYQNMIDEKQYYSQDIDINIKNGLTRTDKLFLPNLEYISLLEDQLLNANNFKIFFRSSAGQSQKMWDRFKNGIETNDSEMNALLYELKILRQSTEYLLAKVDISNERTHSYFSRLTELIDWLMTKNYKTEDAKPLYDFLWELYTGDNFWSGIDNKNSLQEKLKKL